MICYSDSSPLDELETPRQGLLPTGDRLRFWLGKFATFSRWQLAAQGLQLLTGLCLVRWLGYDQYAQYGLVVGFQIMLGILVDLGFSEAVVALVGDRFDDRAVVGRYLSAAWAQRTKLLLVLAPLSAIGFRLVSCGQHWPAVETIILFGSVIAFLYFQGWSAVFATPLLMHQQVSRLYRPRIVASLAVLSITLLLHLTGALSTVWVVWLNVAGAVFVGAIYRSASRGFLEPDGNNAGEANREMRRYLAPLFVGIIFYAIHGQIQTLLIAYFGRSKSIAEVTALGRIGQLLAFASAFVSMIMVPAMARAATSQVRLRYAQGVLMVLAVGGVLFAAASVFPDLFLLLLGPKYAGLRHELLLTVAGSVFAFIGGSLYAFNNARKWMSHLNVVSTIVGALIADVLFIAFVDLSQVRNVLMLCLVTNLVPVFPLAITAWRGCAREAAQGGMDDPLPAEAASAPVL